MTDGKASTAAEDWRKRVMAVRAKPLAIGLWEILVALRENLSLQIETEAWVFERALGDETGRQYWLGWLGSAWPVSSVARLLVSHQPPLTAAADMDLWLAERQTDLKTVLQDAVDAGELSLRPADHTTFGKPVLRVRHAAKWLRGHPVHGGWLPPSLRGLMDASRVG